MGLKSMGKKLYVTVVTTSFPLKEESSSGIFVKRLVENLPRDICATVVVPDGRDIVPPEQFQKNYKVDRFRYAPKHMQILAHEPGGIPVALKSGRNKLLLVPFFACLVSSVVRHSFRSEIFHANWSVIGVITGLVSRIFCCVSVTTLRGEDVTRARRSSVFRWMLQLCIALNEKIVCVSESMANDVSAMFPSASHKICHISNGVGDEFLAIDRAFHEKNNLRVLMVGSLIPRKNVSVALKAISMLDADYRPELEVVGDGVDRPQLEALAEKLGIKNCVHFCGSSSPESIHNFYLHTDVFVLSSHNEGRPNVVVEAMASKLPVIASKIGGVTELVKHGENGLLFEPNDAEMLASHLDTLRKNVSYRKTLAEQARKFIFDNGFSWEAAAGKYAEVYRHARSEEA